MCFWLSRGFLELHFGHMAKVGVRHLGRDREKMCIGGRTVVRELRKPRQRASAERRRGVSPVSSACPLPRVARSPPEIYLVVALVAAVALRNARKHAHDPCELPRLATNLGVLAKLVNGRREEGMGGSGSSMHGDECGHAPYTRNAWQMHGKIWPWWGIGCDGGAHLWGLHPWGLYPWGLYSWGLYLSLFCGGSICVISLLWGALSVWSPFYGGLYLCGLPSMGGSISVVSLLWGALSVRSPFYGALYL